MLQNYICKKTFNGIVFPNIEMPKSNIQQIMKTHQWRYYRAKCVSVKWVAMAVECECTICSLGAGFVLGTEQLH
jgi:hypothetical protein